MTLYMKNMLRYGEKRILEFPCKSYKKLHCRTQQKSVAGTLLTTESVVSTIKEETPAMPAGAPGMGMM